MDDEPPSGPPLDLWGEWRLIRHGIEATKDEVTGAIYPIAMIRLNPPTLERLYDSLHPGGSFSQYQVVHFAGHGFSGGLQLEKENGREYIARIDDLVRVFGNSGVRLAVLNACETINIAYALHDRAGVPSILCSLCSIDDEDAKRLALRVYARLARGDTVGDALHEAKQFLLKDLLPKIESNISEAELEKQRAEYQQQLDRVFTIVGNPNVRILGPRLEKVEEKSFCSFSEPPHDLPVGELLGQFVGRGSQLVQISEWLSQANNICVAITGIGGIGKSALALIAAVRNCWRYDAVLYVTAKDQTDFPWNLFFSLLDSFLGTNVSGQKDQGLQKASAIRLLSFRRVLLVLDNLESLRQKEHDLLTEFLRSIDLTRSGTMALVTLRPTEKQPLTDLAGTYRIRLDSLDEPSALLYLFKRISTNGALWTKVTERPVKDDERIKLIQLAKKAWINYHAISLGRIASLVDLANSAYCHPELLKLTVGNLLINPRFDLSAVSERLERLEGHTLEEKVEDMIGKMVKDLNAIEAEAVDLIRMILVFRGGASEDSLMFLYAKDSSQNGSEFGRIIELAVGSSLLDVIGSGKYDLHPLVRQYLSRNYPLTKTEKEKWREHHAEYHLGYLRERQEDMDMLEREKDNIFDGMNWCRTQNQEEMVINYACYLARFFRLRGYYVEGRERLKWGIDVTVKIEDRSHGAFLAVEYGMICTNQGDYNNAEEYCRSGLEIAEQLNDLKTKTRSLHQLGYICSDLQRYSEAVEYFNRSLEINEKIGDQHGTADTLCELGIVHTKQEKYQEAEAFFKRSLEIYKKIDYVLGTSAALDEMGTMFRKQGDFRKARDCYQQSLNISSAKAHRFGMAVTMHNLGVLEREQKNFERAIDYHEKSLHLSKLISADSWITHNLYGLGLIAEQQGEIQSAIEYWENGLRLAEQMRIPLASEFRVLLKKYGK